MQQKLAEGMTFEEAVQQFSMNEKTAQRKGVLGYVQAGSNTVPALGQHEQLAAAILQLDENQISAPLTADGRYHIFKVMESKPAVIRSLDDVRQQVESQVRAMKEKELQQELMQRLLSADNVKIYSQVFQETR